jgi:3-(3-hydroxy-phenyl)propionate hydroxylase
MIRKAKLVGWAMTGGQDRAAAVRKLLLSAAVRSPRIRERVASTVTPPLRTAALRHPSRRSHPQRTLRVGALIPNPVLCLANGKHVHLDDVLDGCPAMVTARRPEADLLALCRRHGITPVRISTEAATSADTAWVDTCLAPGRTTRLQALVDDPSLTVLIRPDRVIAAVATQSKPPRLPWIVP